MAFKLTIETNDPAFSDDPVGELRKLVDDIVTVMNNGWTSRVVVDNKGDIIGEWSYEPPEIDDPFDDSAHEAESAMSEYMIHPDTTTAAIQADKTSDAGERMTHAIPIVPLTHAPWHGVKRQTTASESVCDDVQVSIDEIIERDREQFLDLLDELTRAGDAEAAPLSNISWEVVRLGSEPNTIVISVIGTSEDTDD